MERLMFIDFEDLEFIHPKMKKLLAYIYDQFGFQTITSLYRIGDKGVHGQLPLRGVDLRIGRWHSEDRIERTINEAWIYDPERPEMRVAIYHNVGLGAHLHLQVHDKTERRT